ncbi:hypothetical protein [Mangrovicella endophytica]|uniref:hypothetical protein n=1 Tax=Mangrovicella endophytica TaxID=2066697 RepID=UPI000C9E5643|nr:hypothetical protein [Mangrovicella endophytica]
MTQAAMKIETSDLDDVVDQILTAAGGDVRAAILGLVRRQHELVAETRRSVSAGYVRRGLRS